MTETTVTIDGTEEFEPNAGDFFMDRDGDVFLADDEGTCVCVRAREASYGGRYDVDALARPFTLFRNAKIDLS